MGRELQAMLQQIERTLPASSADTSALNANRLLLQVALAFSADVGT